jgi:hypothetical protein
LGGHAGASLQKTGLAVGQSRRPDRLFGLCDFGFGEPELGYVSLAEIRSIRGKLSLPVERGLYFRAILSDGGYVTTSLIALQNHHLIDYKRENRSIGAVIGGLWRARRDSNSQPPDP